MSMTIVDTCTTCGKCELACPTWAIHSPDGPRLVFVVDPDLCDDCLECRDVCPVGALVEGGPDLLARTA